MTTHLTCAGQGPCVTGIPADFERRVIECAKRWLDDIPSCRSATYRIRWIPGVTRGLVPVLVLGFDHPNLFYQPALAIALITVQRGTLADSMPGKTILEGERLRSRILESIEAYFGRHGVPFLEIVEGN